MKKRQLRKLMRKAIRTVLKSCWPMKISAITGTRVAFGMALKPTSSG